MSWLAGAALAIAVLTVRGPGGRPVGPLARSGGQGSAARDPGRGAPEGGLARGRTLVRRLGGRRPRPTDLALLLTDVASRLRAGADPQAAWEAALGRSVGPAGPVLGDLRPSAGAGPQAAAVVAAGRLAADLGAPLAPLLDRVAAQLEAQAEADGERRAALAGPRATAQVLTGLPVLGVLLGVAVGSDPIPVLLDGGIGSAALVAGIALVLTGRAWTGRLAHRAASAGRSS